MMQDNVKKMLGEITLLTASRRNAQERFSAQLAPDFRIFNYLKNSETGLSTCLADLLDPAQAHGQKRLFLDAFLDCISKAGLQKADEFLQITQNQMPTLYTEYATHAIAATQRRIDIVLEFQDCIIGIENKPWTIDQNNQLDDYAKQLMSSGKKRWLLIYLCDSEPSFGSISDADRKAHEGAGNFLALSFSQLADLLEYCAAHTKSLTVRVFVEELEKYVKENVMGNRPEDEKNEIVKILLQGSNFAAAQSVAKVFHSAQRSLLTDFLEELERQLKAKNPKLTLGIDDKERLLSGTKWCWLDILCQSNQSKRLRFQFSKQGYVGLFWGIVASTGVVSGEQQIWDEIHSKMSGQYTRGKKDPTWWPWHSYECEPLFAKAKDAFAGTKEAEDFTNLTNQDYSNWGDTAYVWRLMQVEKSKFAASIVALAVEVYELFETDMHLLK